MNKPFVLMMVFVAVAFLSASATIINVPDDYPTIHEGIDASFDGDTVLVQPGEYVENINFNGHNIVLGSLFLTTGDTSYISSTIIDGDSSGSVATFESGEDSTAIISGFTLLNGYGQRGGGIYCWQSSPTVSNNTIIGNSTGWAGGGILCYHSDAIISRNSISCNSANSSGGGIYCINYSHATISDNTINGNSTNSSGGGIYCYNNSDLTISNNTISGNSAIGGGGISCTYCNPIIINTIFWDDSTQNANEILINGGSPVITYCDIQGGWEGEGNIDADPLFRNPGNGDFHLMAIECGDPYNSPCIDAGHPDILDSLLDCSWGLGEPRSDMGAYGGGDSVQVGIDNREVEIPYIFTFTQNYPNPFNASTTIIYSIPKASNVSIDIYDSLVVRLKRLLISNSQRVTIRLPGILVMFPQEYISTG